MKQIMLVGEDPLCCALGESLIQHCLPGWQLATPAISTRGITKLIPELPRYQQIAAHKLPVLCIADTDRACPIDCIKKWLPHKPPANFLLRLAVTESESWVLADRDGFAGFLGIAAGKIATSPDELPDAKRHLLQLAKHSKVRLYRQEMVTANGDKQGTGYNLHLASFVRQHWSPQGAAASSPSLARAILRLQQLATPL